MRDRPAFRIKPEVLTTEVGATSSLFHRLNGERHE
jgi:hypothetical protein